MCLIVSLYAMCLALCDVLKMDFTVYWEIWISRINNTFGRFIAGVRQVDSWDAFGMVVKIACAHLSQKLFVHYMRTLSVFATESSEHCTIHGINVRVNCETTIFGGDAGWIVRETNIFIFNFQNIFIQSVKQSRNKAANYLVRLFVFQPGCMINWGFVPIESFSCY